MRPFDLEGFDRFQRSVSRSTVDDEPFVIANALLTQR